MTSSAAPESPRLSREIGELLRLSMPLSIGFAGSTLLGFVDTAMVGRLGTSALAAVGIGNGLFFALALVGMGLVAGADPLIAQAVGAGEMQTARRAFWQAARIAVYASVPMLAIVFALAFGLESFGIDPTAARATRMFLYGRALNAPMFLLFAAARSYLQAAGVTRPIVVSIVIANIANFVFDGLLVFGDRALVATHLPPIGLPALGVFGAGLSSTLASVASTAIVLRAVRGLPAPDKPAARKFDAQLLRKNLRLGTPIALQLLAEVGAFTLATLFCGHMGSVVVAGHHVALSIASFTFTTALGVSSATTVFVGKAVGRGNTSAARRWGFLGVGIGCTFMGVCAVGFFVAPLLCARILTDQADVLAAAMPLIQIAAFFQLSDGAQGVFAGALRGAGDTRYPQWANVFGHYAVGVPIAFVLGFYTSLGARGVWWGLSAGLTVVAVLLGLRFNRLTKGSIARA